MVNSLKIAVLGSSEEEVEFTSKSTSMSSKIKKVNMKTV